MKTKYAPHRPQQKIISLSNAKVTAGVSGYGWHINPIPIGSGYEDRHSDKIKINNFSFLMQLRDGADGNNSYTVHNVYLFLVRDNSSGPSVPTFDKICTMDNSNPATAVVDHDARDRFKIMRKWHYTFSGACKAGSTYYSPCRYTVDFSKFKKINMETEYKSSTDGSYANIQKNAWVLYLVGQSYDFYVDGHVRVTYTSIV